MPYPELLIQPMREDLTRFGVQETRSPEALDSVIRENGTVMVIVNSVCGCAAGRARPAVGMALNHSVLPDKVVSVFAGADIEATQHARNNYFKGYFPSSPSIGILQNGKVVFMLERHQIEGREAPEIAKDLTDAFDKYCVKTRA